MEFDIEINCCLCDESYQTKIQLPEDWASVYNGTTVDDGFCPNHIIIADWADNQCPGCVEGWGDCSLWQSFAYQDRENLSDDDFAKIKSGICPKRTNGTFGFSAKTGQLDKIDLSKTGTVESGIALEKAIKDYLEKYP